jgi:uncharacterized membrane protein
MAESVELSQPVQRPRPRIESLTDLVFGLALSIGAIGLINNKPRDTPSLIVSIGGFGLSFLILISIWFRYTEVMSILRVEVARTRILNTTLFLVAIEPYLFNLLNFNGPFAAGSLVDAASVGFAIDLGTIYAIMASFTSILGKEGSGLATPDIVKKYRHIRNFEIVVAIIFLISALPEFWIMNLPGGFVAGGGPLRYYAWLLTFPLIKGENILSRWKSESRLLKRFFTKHRGRNQVL